MSQMQEGEQEKQLEGSSNAWVLPVMKGMFIVLGVAIILSIVGVTLGAINFMSGPVHYPAWLLAAWLVVDILLLVLLLLHLVLYGFVGVATGADEPLPVFMGVGIVLLLVGGIMLGGKHLAWVSVGELLLFVVAVVINVTILVQMRES